MNKQLNEGVTILYRVRMLAATSWVEKNNAPRDSLECRQLKSIRFIQSSRRCTYGWSLLLGTDARRKKGRLNS